MVGRLQFMFNLWWSRADNYKSFFNGVWDTSVQLARFSKIYDRERRLFTGLIPIPWYIFEDLNDGYRLLGTRLASRSAFPALVAQVETKLLRHANWSIDTPWTVKRRWTKEPVSCCMYQFLAGWCCCLLDCFEAYQSLNAASCHNITDDDGGATRVLKMTPGDIYY